LNHFDKIFDEVYKLDFILKRGTSPYESLEKMTKETVRKSKFATDGIENLGPFGVINLPYLEMGKITTLDLFGIDEIILFAWYAKNRNQYGRVADLGSNVGLHSILMSKIGWAVEAYEADPDTAKILEKNLKLNSSENVLVHNSAVSTKNGSESFIRVKDNLTGSHIKGAKKDPYGEIESFIVPTVSIKNIMAKCDLIKMDVEGSEADIISSTNSHDWNSIDAMIEIGSLDNSKRIFSHLSNLGVKMYSQKNNWESVTESDQLPYHHTQGTVFCSSRRNFFEFDLNL
jgi:FkbM family methyltransferase